VSISDERLAEISGNNAPNFAIGDSDFNEYRQIAHELQSFRAAAKVRANSEGDGEVRKVAFALDCLRHLDDEISRVPSKPDPVTVNNLTYWAAQLRTALASIPATGGEKPVASPPSPADVKDIPWPGRKFCEIAERNAWELAKFIKGEDDKQVVTDAALAIKTLLEALQLGKEG
jgi:hypothetical protein